MIDFIITFIFFLLFLFYLFSFSQTGVWTQRRYNASAIDPEADGADGATRVPTAAEPWNRGIPLRNKSYSPAGLDPKVCFTEAARARHATLQADDVVANDEAAATALPWTAPARVEAPRPEDLF